MDSLRWEDEPDLEELRKLVAQLASQSPDAIKGLEALGERGSVASAAHLAEFYMSNDDGSDNSRAIYWYSKAHENGYAPASYMLGRLYSKRQQYDLAFTAFSKGAEAGYAPAIYRLAKSYQYGQGVPRNYAECRRLLERARGKGHIFAKRDLAAILLTGRFGLIQVARGVAILLCLWIDIGKFMKKVMSRKPYLDETLLA